MNGIPHLRMTGYGADDKELIITGSYTAPGQPGGIRIYELDEKSGELTPLFEGGRDINPSFLAIRDGMILGVSEVSRDSQITLYRWLEHEKRLLPVDHLHVPGASLCHITPWPGTPYFTVSGYNSGSFLLCREEHGKLYLDREEFPGEDYFEPGFEGRVSHVHSTLLSPDNCFLYVADLGLDRIFCYGVHEQGGIKLLEKKRQIIFPWGEGPRHMAVSKDGKNLYVVTELNNHVFTFSMDEERNAQQRQVLPVGHELFSQEAAAGADIKISDDGRCVYVSDRGPDTVTLFARDRETGDLRHVKMYDSGGHWPRNICLSRSQRFLLAANERSGDLAVFARDPRTGVLKGRVCSVHAQQISFAAPM